MDKETLDLIQTIPKEVWLQLYNDAPRPMLRQFGRLGDDLAKTLRLVTLPIQCTAYIQDRIDEGFKKALEKIPEDRRIFPPEGLALDIAERLKHHDSKSLIGRLYVELLSASMDQDRNNQAHPAFLPIIGQLSSDEALLLLRISEHNPMLTLKKNNGWESVMQTESKDALADITFYFHGLERKLLDLTVHAEEFYYPENFYIYIEHLIDLGLIEFDIEANNQPWSFMFDNGTKNLGLRWVRLTKFGLLFFECCSEALKS